MTSVKITFTYTRQEYVRAVRRYLFAAGKLRKLDFIIFAVCAVMAVYYVIKSYGAPSLIFLLLVVLAALIYAWAYVFMPVRVFNTTARLHEEYALEFTGDEILFKTSGINSTLTWSVYCKYLENKEFFYLLQAGNAYTVIPKRAFENAAQMAEFALLLAAKLPPAKNARVKVKPT